MIARPLRGLLLLGLEPELDCADATGAVTAVQAADFVLAMSPYLSGSIEQHADVVLPLGSFAETSGTFVNAEGCWQSFAAVAAPLGQARPGWKVLRVLANLLDMPDSHYQSSHEVRDELRAIAGDLAPHNSLPANAPPGMGSSADVPPQQLDVPLYRIDPLVRRAQSLQLTRDGRQAQASGIDGRETG